MFTERQRLRMLMLAEATTDLPINSPVIAPIPGSAWWPAGGMDVVVSEWLPDGMVMAHLDSGQRLMMNPETLSLIMCAVYRKEIVRKDLERIVARVMAR